VLASVRQAKAAERLTEDQLLQTVRKTRYSTRAACTQVPQHKQGMQQQQQQQQQ